MKWHATAAAAEAAAERRRIVCAVGGTVLGTGSKLLVFLWYGS